MLSVLLSAIGYPTAVGFSNHPNSQGYFRSFVRWLENEKIRHWNIEKREQGLNRITDPNWESVLLEYLKDLGYNGPHNSNEPALTAEWLLRFAISIKYEDNVSEYNSAADAFEDQHNADPKPASGPGGDMPLFHDVRSQAVKDSVAGLCEALGIPREDCLVKDLTVIGEALRGRVLPAVRKWAESDDGSLALERLCIEGGCLPLGFVTGDPDVDLAATALRALYVKDLRSLQTQIDRAIIRLQDLTANPRTNSAIGKIGR
uniref:RLL motif containing protein 1 n=1 Tax=Tetraselmis sp. GSL018 TaxID=582737 RepID=A0A061RHU4_9CHLO